MFYFQHTNAWLLCIYVYVVISWQLVGIVLWLMTSYTSYNSRLWHFLSLLAVAANHTHTPFEIIYCFIFYTLRKCQLAECQFYSSQIQRRDVSGQSSINIEFVQIQFRKLLTMGFSHVLATVNHSICQQKVRKFLFASLSLFIQFHIHLDRIEYSNHMGHKTHTNTNTSTFHWIFVFIFRLSKNHFEL